MKKKAALKQNPAGYADLLKKVKRTLALGRQKVERETVKTYWLTGKIIHDHFLASKGRADYGKKVFEKLAEDLELDPSVLRRTVKFYETYPIQAAWPELSWGHFRKLMTIPNKKLRLEYTARANKEKWTVLDLERKVDAELTPDNAEGGGSLPEKKKPGARKSKIPVLKGKCGKLYHYRIRRPDTLHRNPQAPGGTSGRPAAFAKGNPDLLEVDLGFKTSRELASVASAELEKGDYVKSLKTDHEWEYSVEKMEASEADLYTYKASLERVVDGDTLLVHIDLGFGIWLRQYLRLRGVNTPEINTSEGLNARNYLRHRFEKISWFVMTSSRSDKYDRYLADVWLPDPKKEDAFLLLNQELLDQKIAVLAPS